jgi:hypothetical protein
MRHGLVVNVPNLLLNLLKKNASETQKGRENLVAHHALIKLLIAHSLRDVSPLSWQEFITQKGI